MSGFIAIASSKEIVLPSEIQEYNDNRIFDLSNMHFGSIMDR
jgi:hypothetical protein